MISVKEFASRAMLVILVTQNVTFMGEIIEKIEKKNVFREFTFGIIPRLLKYLYVCNVKKK